MMNLEAELRLATMLQRWVQPFIARAIVAGMQNDDIDRLAEEMGRFLGCLEGGAPDKGQNAHETPLDNAARKVLQLRISAYTGEERWATRTVAVPGEWGTERIENQLHEWACSACEAVDWEWDDEEWFPSIEVSEIEPFADSEVEPDFDLTQGHRLPLAAKAD